MKPIRWSRMMFLFVLVLGFMFLRGAGHPDFAAAAKIAEGASIPRGYDPQHVWVKFKDELNIAVGPPNYPVDRSGVMLQEQPAQALFQSVRAAGGKWERAVGPDEATMDAMRATAERNLGRSLPDLNNYFLLTVPSGMDAFDLMAQLNALTEVEATGFQPLPMPAPAPSNYQAQQGYLTPATNGIDAAYAWGIAGGTGTNVTICDLEYSWNLSHQDLPAGITTFVPGGKTATDPFGDNNHGTAVLGEMSSRNNGTGTTGAAYGATFRVAPASFTDGYQPALALTNAMGSLGAGDVIIIEQQIAGPNWPGGSTQMGLVPLEWLKPVYDAIVTAVGNGIHVVAAAGNGSQNLDDAVYGTGNGGHHPFLAANRSGAIIVGAGAAPAAFSGSDTDRSRLGFSNYGSRLDLQGWGERVTTTGYGTLYNSDGVNLFYTGGFNGTSSATPIVTSAVADYESVWEAAHGGSPATPAAVRTALINTGSPQQSGTNPASEHIGPRPNLGAALCFADHTAPTITCPASVTVECSSPSGTSAFLGAALATDNCDPSPTITNDAPAQFQLGATTVTFTARDASGNTSTCTSNVTVIDTSNPVVGCPAPLTVECTQAGGTPKTNPQIAAWLASATASDVCDPAPVLVNNAPALFPDGTTLVTFAATDHSANTGSCNTTLKVQDTTAPTLAVSLDRVSLWPPNHKLVTINATVTVTDICDPSPTFVLTSITSNEPVNGTGDGDTSPDIVGADFGTPDASFQLRSERSGGGNGRIYTIVYTASDAAGNHTSQTVHVTVAHDQGGHALVSEGFDEAGADFAPGATEFAVVVPSVTATPTPVEGEVDLGGPVSGPIETIDPLALSLDASDLALSITYVGNTAGCVAPLRSLLADVNGDGRPDAVCFYDVEAVKALRSASSPLDGPIGIHFTSNDRRNFLVPDLFSLGIPIPLPLAAMASRASSATRTETKAASGSVSDHPAPATGAPVSAALPGLTRLAGVFPNPFGRDATVAFELARPERVSLEVYDLRGARVRTLASGGWSAGRYQIAWDGRDERGRLVPGGVYLVRFEAASKPTVLKAVFMR